MVSVSTFGTMDRSLVQTYQTMLDSYEHHIRMFFTCDKPPNEIRTREPLKWKVERSGASLSITCSLLHWATCRKLSRCSKQGIFRQIISSQYISFNNSNAKELDRRHSSSSSVNRTRHRYSLSSFPSNQDQPWDGRHNWRGHGKLYSAFCLEAATWWVLQSLP